MLLPHQKPLLNLDLELLLVQPLQLGTLLNTLRPLLHLLVLLGSLLIHFIQIHYFEVRLRSLPALYLLPNQVLLLLLLFLQQVKFPLRYDLVVDEQLVDFLLVEVL